MFFHKRVTSQDQVPTTAANPGALMVNEITPELFQVSLCGVRQERACASLDSGEVIFVRARS